MDMMPVPFDDLPEHVQEMIRVQREEHDRKHMQHDQIQTRVHNLLDRMDADDLVTLRFIVLAGDGSESVMMNQWNGQIIALLRNLHQVDELGNPLGIPQMEEQQTGVVLDAQS